MNVYKILLSANLVVDKAKVCWDRKLKVELSEGQWHKILKCYQMFSANIVIRENWLKLLDRWYLALEKLERMLPPLRGNCWKCNQEGADYFHMWLRCPKVQEFWYLVGTVLSQIVGVQILLVPRLMLLLDFEFFHLQSYKIILAHGSGNALG